MKNFLIINLHSSRNAGDDVLTRATLQQFQVNLESPTFTLAMNDPASYGGDELTVASFMTWLKPVNEDGWRLGGVVWLLTSLAAAMLYRLTGAPILFLTPVGKRPLLKAYFEADAVVSSAGNFLYSSGKWGLPFLIAIYTMAYAWLAGKPLYMMPQTIGPLRRKRERQLIKWITSKTRLVFVRDAISKAELERSGAWRNNCALSPDMAFIAGKSSPNQGDLALWNDKDGGQRSPLLGVTLINWGAQNHLFTQQSVYETAVAQTIRFFVNEYQGKAILFSQVRGPSKIEDDFIPAERVKNMLDDLGSQVVLIEQELSPETLKAAYGQVDLFIGSRLHSNIFALSEDVPAIMIQYQYKTRGIAQMLDLERWVIEIERVTEPALTHLLQNLWEERQAVQEHLQTVMPAILHQTSQVAAKIAADMENS